MQIPQSSFLNLENLREKNFSGEGQEPCPALTTPQARGEQEVAQDCVWEVGQLVTGGVEKQVGKVPFLGNQLCVGGGVSWIQAVKKVHTTNAVFSPQSKLQFQKEERVSG